ncbi:MAG TPA: hypothetical protein PLN13_03530 [Bacteroidia bacterium]|nr:hypothetical protein [Bacteroidia bacterium]HRH07626.1 hypothetical protein [Bacteroidia bacterium]
MGFKSLVYLFEVMMGSSFLYAHKSLHNFFIDGDVFDDSDNETLTLEKDKFVNAFRESWEMAIAYSQNEENVGHYKLNSQKKPVFDTEKLNEKSAEILLKLISIERNEKKTNESYEHAKTRDGACIKKLTTVIDKKYKDHFSILGFSSFAFIVIACYFGDKEYSSIPPFVIGYILSAVILTNTGSKNRPLFITYLFKWFHRRFLSRYEFIFKIRKFFRSMRNKTAKKKPKKQKHFNVLEVFLLSLLFGGVIAFLNYFAIRYNTLIFHISNYFEFTLALTGIFLVIPWFIYFADAYVIHRVYRENSNKSLMRFIESMQNLNERLRIPSK